MVFGALECHGAVNFRFAKRMADPVVYRVDKIGQRIKDGHARLVWQRQLGLLHAMRRFRFEFG